jgi:hypothetical protein
MAMRVAVGDDDVFHLTGFDLIHELGKCNFLFSDIAAVVDDSKKEHRQTNQHYPEDQSFYIRIHETSHAGQSATNWLYCQSASKL